MAFMKSAILDGNKSAAERIRAQRDSELPRPGWRVEQASSGTAPRPRRNPGYPSGDDGYGAPPPAGR